jgi:peptidyl-prolyl cis-trans isomerase SurA
MKVIRFIVSLFFLSSPALWAAQELVDGIAAVVGRDVILISELKEAQKSVQAQRVPRSHMSETQVLDELIKEKLLRQEVERLGFEIDVTEKKQTIRQVLAQNRITLDQLKNELRSKGMSFEEYEESLVQRLKVMRFMRQVIYPKVNVSAEEIEVYRKRYPNKSKSQSDEEVRYILVDEKGGETLNTYMQAIRARTFVEIKEWH